MKVYVVTYGQYSDYTIDGIFSSEELANNYIAECNKADHNGYYDGYNSVEELDIDYLAERTCKDAYKAEIDVRDGNLVEKPTEKEVVGNERSGENDWLMLTTYRLGEKLLTKNIKRTSYVSQDHVNKLCVESRQELLRLNLFNVDDLKGQNDYYYSF